MWTLRESGRGPCGDFLDTFFGEPIRKGTEPSGPLAFWDKYIAGQMVLRKFPIGVRRPLILIYPLAWLLWWPLKVITILLFVILVFTICCFTLFPLFAVDFTWTKLGWLRELWDAPADTESRQ